MLYMGMSMYSTYLGGNAYTNYLISGLVELPAYFAGPLLLNRFALQGSDYVNVSFSG